MWNGKPAIIGYPDGLTAGEAPVSGEVRKAFTWRTGWADVDTASLQNEWQWIDSVTPQNWGYVGRPDIPEQVPVACGGWCNSNLGRSNYNRSQPAYDKFHLASDRTGNQGLFFSEQIFYGLKLDPKLMFTTGWNEWRAGAWTAPLAGGGYRILDNSCAPRQRYFVDNYTAEYSRDIEPMKGGHGDNYYYQMVAANRLRKGVRPVPPASLALSEAPMDFSGVMPAYQDAPDETLVRDAPSSFSNLANWMNLFLDIDRSRSTGWEGYDYVINFGGSGQVQRLSSGVWKPVRIGTARVVVTGNQMVITVPRAMLGLGADPLKFDFHWTDNLQTPCDISDFGMSGDSAPERRFNYRYQTAPEQAVVLRADGFESGQHPSWGETYGAGGQWNISVRISYTGSKCLVGTGKIGASDASGTLIHRADTEGLASFRTGFRYKLSNVSDARDIQIYYRNSSQQWIAIRELRREPLALNNLLIARRHGQFGRLRKLDTVRSEQGQINKSSCHRYFRSVASAETRVD